MNATLFNINGPVCMGKNMDNFTIGEMVLIGKNKLIGEVISLSDGFGTIQVYEETEGLKIHDDVLQTNMPLSVKLGPGMIGNMFDGIQRPLNKIREIGGSFIPEGIGLLSLDNDKLWDTQLLVSNGDIVSEGEIYALIPESELITHKLMIPIGIKGKVQNIVPNGKYNIETTLFEIVDEFNKVKEIKMYQYWPVKFSRPVQERLPATIPLITGQRVIDVFFPIVKGGTTGIPGGFGTGKTMLQHQLAKYSDADIIVYIGCGERGNEMTEVLEDFPKLIDPNSNKPLMQRTILIANTSNMPVAAREASIYTGITMAEYFRDMGYNVAIMADSSSRWAEAMREISGRLEEMPAEEGFPAYLPSKLSHFYERAGYVENLNRTNGSVTVIAAVSPAGGDFSEPVTEYTKRYVNVFLGLDKDLAYSRHYPAISWLSSYSKYIDSLKNYFEINFNIDVFSLRKKMLNLLYSESKLKEIVMLVGEEVLPDKERFILEISKILKIGFLQQSAVSPIDSYVPMQKQVNMLQTISNLYDEAMKALDLNIPISLVKNNELFFEVTQMKYNIKNDDSEAFIILNQKINSFYDELKLPYLNEVQ